MSYQSKLKKLYNSELRPKLIEMESLRKNVRNKLIITIINPIFTFFIIFFWNKIVSTIDTHFQFRLNDTFFFIFIPLILFSIYFGYLANTEYKKYKTVFKKEIVGKIFKLLAKELKYNHNGFISKNLYDESRLFRKEVDRYRGDDYLHGKVGEVDFKFSEVHSEYKKVTSDSKGNRRTRWYTIFQGIFIVAEFNKNINYDTYVLPDKAEKSLGKLGHFFQRNKIGKHAKHLIKLENTKFEKEFLVYGDDQIESRYILTPKIMESFLRIQKSFNSPIHASFRGNHVFIAISLKENMFEPEVFKTCVNFNSIVKMGRLLQSSVAIIKELDLNNDIWNKTKEGA